MGGTYKKQGTVAEVYDVSTLGHGLKLVSTRKVQFNHKEAIMLLEKFEDFVGDRKLKQPHVDQLVRAMIRGTFHWEWVTIIICVCEGKSFRMNGQHTAWARLELPDTTECEVKWLEYKAETMEDMRMLYSSIDRASPRTKANVIESYIVGTPEFKEVKSNTLRIVPQGFGLWRWPGKHERGQYDGDDVAYLLKTDHYDLTIKVCSFLDKQSPREQKHIFRSPVVGAMYATFHKAPHVALEFWGPVSDGTGFEKKGDPRLKLRNELLQSSVSLGGGMQSDKKKMPQENMYRLCIAAWNAYRQGRSLQILRATSNGKRPTVK